MKDKNKTSSPLTSDRHIPEAPPLWRGFPVPVVSDASINSSAGFTHSRALRPRRTTGNSRNVEDIGLTLINPWDLDGQYN